MNLIFYSVHERLTRTSATTTADPIAYRNINGAYQAPASANVTTLLDFIKSRSDLSSLASAVEGCGGFTEAFSTDATWDYTFFAPNNDAFEQYTGTYFHNNAETP
ncbi:FAS1 domain-containing protein [Penicillium lagena]|uniref:FAS1 domain-containing protein n=1 Tax=Penicillium lagena TaxID=94218 RepID=UPI002541B75F|nr:FAS1 domain-containing protein [Penicillium lagena]KAJ5619124.1 FAS1 domain-containing protein [Penicillium lagena]